MTLTQRIVTAAAVCLTCSVVMADIYHLAPTPADLQDLAHRKYYTWGIDRPWGTDEQVVSATLSFDNIRNWRTEPNWLYIHLLDDGPLGVTVRWDGQGGGNAFAGMGVELITYVNLPTTPQDLSYEFAVEQLNALNDYSADDRFALGFDPDCHFYNCGVGLDVVTEVGIPEPGTLALLMLGAIGALARKIRRS